MSEPITFPNDRVFEVLGERFVERGGQVLRLTGEIAAEAAGAEAGGAVLAAAAVATAALPGVPVSREEGERIGAAERAQRAEAVAHAHGGPVALPTPSPFQNEAFVRALPPRAAIDATTAPHPRAGDEPQFHAPGTPMSRVPGMAPPLSSSEAGDLAHEYAYVATTSTKDGVAALTAVNNCMPDEREFRSFGALKTATKATTPPGWEVHHIVEQNQLPRFGSEVIQNTANAIALPDGVHKKVSARYSAAPIESEGIDPKKFSHLRDYVQTLPFEEQREFGIKAVRRAMDSLHISQQTRDVIEKELNKLDVPGLCAPQVPPTSKPPDLDTMRDAVDAHNQTHDRPLPNARSVSDWDGRTRVGSFVDLGNGLVAQHLGRGDYMVVDVERQLGGVRPPIGQFATLQRDGQVQVQEQSLGLQRG